MAETTPRRAREKSPPRPVRIVATPWRTPIDEVVRAGAGEMPAYLRRAQAMEREIDSLWRAAAAARAERLGFVGLRLRRLLDTVAPEELRIPEGRAVRAIHREVVDLPAFRRLRPRAPTKAGPALAALRDSVRRFNDRWRRWVGEDAPLDRVNDAIDGYNRWFRFERECAVRWVPLDRLSFTPRERLTVGEVLARLPALPEP